MSQSWLALCFAVLGLTPLLVEASESTKSESARAVWKEGKHYEALAQTIARDSGYANVRVIEFFWYGCPHCYALEPHLSHWLEGKPARIEVLKVPVGYSAESRAHARLFYVLNALDRPDLHKKVFESIHEQKNRLFAKDDEQKTRALQRAFAVASGIDGDAFERALDSSEVAARVQRATELAMQCAVDGVPMFVVDGRYKTSAGRAGGRENLFAVIEHILAKEMK